MSKDTTHTQPTSPEATADHGAAAHAAETGTDGSSVFTELLASLGDHHELNIFFNHFTVLPVILYDADGLHVYKNEHAMTEAGLYTSHEGHPVKVSDGSHATLDLSVTNFVAYEWIAMAVVTVLLMVARGRYKKQPLEAPKGVQNIIESIVLYVRDEIVRPNVGTIARTHRLMPYLLGIFFFVLTLNLLGLLPGCHAATGALGVTAALALTTFFVVNFIAIKDAGIKSWLKHLLGGAPWYMFLIMVPIEIISLFTKPFALMIRLFANMTAGHIVLLSLVGLIFFFKSWLVTPVSVSFSVFIYLLELLVAFLQAYIFTMLASVFVGLALGDHATEDHHNSHAH